jgi:hypothetical protein
MQLVIKLFNAAVSTTEVIIIASIEMCNWSCTEIRKEALLASMQLHPDVRLEELMDTMRNVSSLAQIWTQYLPITSTPECSIEYLIWHFESHSFNYLEVQRV